MASRETARSQRWRLFEHVRFAADGSGRIVAPYLPPDCRLQDDIEILDERHFHLLGRPQNMLKVAGKRYSLDALNHQLLAIDGVEDAATLVPPGRDRPAALVVAPALTAAQIRKALARQVDAVFLPRPLLQVAQIPRSATGKTRQQELLALLNA